MKHKGYEKELLAIQNTMQKKKNTMQTASVTYILVNGHH